MREQDETPKLESEHHSSRFLKKAAQLATKKRGKKRTKKVRSKGR